MSERTEFDANKYITKLKGQDYLEVKFRLLWFRHDHPDGIIDTEIIYRDDVSAIFKATAATHEGARATGYGSETKGDFKDFLEKAETKAIGRALGALGFGTQFAPDLNDGSEQDRPVDSPVPRQDAPPRNRSTSRNTVPDAPQSPVANERPATASEYPTMDGRALASIHEAKNKRGISDDDLHTIALARYGVKSLKDLRVDHGRDLYLMLTKESDEGLKHELWLANGSPEPAQAEMIPDTAGRHRS